MKRFLRWLKNLWRRFKKWDYIESTYKREVDYNDNPPPVREPIVKARVHEVAAALSYPVSPNSRWSFYRQSDQTIVKHNVRWPRADGMEIIGLDADIIPLLNTEDQRPVPVFDPENPTAPVFDPATQVAEGGPSVVDVNANTYNRTWVIRALTQEELDEKATNETNEVEKNQAKAVYADLKNGVGTQAERLARAEKVAAHLLKVKYGDVA